MALNAGYRMKSAGTPGMSCSDFYLGDMVLLK